MTSPPGYISDFDSASGMLRATALALQGKSFPGWGLGRHVKRLVSLGSSLPQGARETIYAGGGLMEGLSPRQTHTVSSERIARWAADLYPDRRYPGVFVGSSSGALTHLATALGMPWLPQTFFVPVRQVDVHPDDAISGMEAGREPAERLLEANPDLQLHHMHDPNQDRLMLQYMTYFRVKYRRLADAYRSFILRNLAPGDPIIVVECNRAWPVTRLGERHVFQFGALGGASEKDFFEGGPRVAEYLEKYGSHRRRWEPPEPTEIGPEAEWGFEPALRDDIVAFAAEHGHPVVTLRFDEPEDLSPFVAEFQRHAYRARGLRANRLFVESFLLVEPHWTLRTGSVPFWMKFNMEPSLEALERYLSQTAGFDEIWLTLFQHGVECVGLPPIEDWERVIARARRRHGFLGLDTALHPRDFGALARYQDDIQAIPSRYPLPGPLTLSAVADFLAGADRSFAVEWQGLDAAGDGASPGARRDRGAGDGQEAAAS